MKVIVNYSPPVRRNSDALDRLSQRLLSVLSRRRKPIRRLATSLLAMCLTLSLSAQYGNSQAPSNENESPPVLLTNAEGRVILGQLYELKALRIELKELRSSQEKELAQYEAEKALWLQRIEQEKQAYELSLQKVSVIERERDLAIEKAKFYEASWNVCKGNKKTSFGCKLKRFFTLGIARCK